MARVKKATSKRKTAAKKSPRKAAAKKPAPKIKKDPIAEYQAAVKTQGIATISTLAQDECVTNITGRVSTGSMALDKALSNPGEPEEWGGGFPLSRVVEIYGPPHIGKSTTLDQGFAAVQRMGGMGILADTETSRDRTYMAKLGVDLDKLQYAQFEDWQSSVEDVLQFVCDSIDWWRRHSPETPVLIGWDALGGTATKDELEKGFAGEKRHEPAAAARAMARAARIVAPKLKGTRVGFVICNHQYQIVGARPGQKQKEAYGGEGTRHLASVRVQLYNGGWIKATDGTIWGNQVMAKIVKNRLGAAWVEVSMAMLVGFGVDNVWTLHDDLSRSALVQTAQGGWVTMILDGQEVKWQGYPGLRRKIDADPELYVKLASVWAQL